MNTYSNITHNVPTNFHQNWFYIFVSEAEQQQNERFNSFENISNNSNASDRPHSTTREFEIRNNNKKVQTKPSSKTKHWLQSSPQRIQILHIFNRYLDTYIRYTTGRMTIDAFRMS